MAEKDQINVKITDKEAKETENNVVEEKMEGKENKEGSEKEKGEVKEETPEKNESTFNRFFGWFRSKPKKEEEHEKEQENKEEIKETKENENKKEAIVSEDSNEVKEEVEEREKDIETFKIKENGIEKGKEDTKDIPATIVENKETLPVSSDRSLLIIEEEGKTGKKLAPLAQAEEEDSDEPSGSRPSIDRPVIEPKSADAVQAERETTENKALSQDDIDAKTEKRKSATVFLHLSQPRFERHSQEGADPQRHDKASEHDEPYQSVEQDNKLVAAQHAAPKKDNQQESKMEEVIEEKRHDARTESMQQTWKNMEELEPNKTYRVSYTVTTTTVDKSSKPKDKSDDDDDDDDDENERLFGEHVLLSNDEQSKPKYDGPPPQDLEPVLTYEEAKKDEAGTADIDKIFAMMAKDGPPPEGGVTVKSTRQDNGSQEILETPEDIFRKLHNWDKEPTDWWTSTKKKRDYEEWMKPMKEGTIRRVIIPKVEIPYDACKLSLRAAY